MPRQRAYQRHHVAPDQRLAAGETDFAHALGDEGRAQPVEFFQRQQVLSSAGRSCPRTCSRSSAGRSDRSRTRADTGWSGRTDRPSAGTGDRMKSTRNRSLNCLAGFGAGLRATAALAQSRHLPGRLQSATCGKLRVQRGLSGRAAPGQGPAPRPPWAASASSAASACAPSAAARPAEFREHRAGVDDGRRRRGKIAGIADHLDRNRDRLELGASQR